MSENLPAKQINFKQYMRADITQQLIQRTLGNIERAQRFTAAILSSVSLNPDLEKCDPKTILSGAFLGDALQLPPNPQLGRFYLVPFGDKKNPYGKVAAFILGFKGYIELAIRTGQYRNIIVLEIKQGEVVKPWNPLTEEISLLMNEDEDKRDKLPTVGYYAMFQMVNGFTKAMYWSKDKMLNHADRYSAAFKKDAYRLLNEGKIAREYMWKYSSFWYKDFDEMAKKTLIRQLISKWGIMSVDIQRAFDVDDHAINADLTPQAEPEVIDAEVITPMPMPVLPDPADDVPDFVQESDKKGKQTKLGEV